MDSSQQNQYPYHASSPSSQSYNRSQFNHHHQQHLPYHNTANPNYSNLFNIPQQQQRQPPIYPPGVQQTAGLNPVVAVVAVALAQELTQFASGYPQPVIGGPPGLGSVSLPGHGPGPSGLLSHAGQSLDKGGVKNSGGQHAAGGRDNFSNFPPRPGGSEQSLQGKGHNRGRSGPRLQPAEMSDSAGATWCELCKVKFGKNNFGKHMSGRKHRRNLKELKPNPSRTVSDIQNEQKSSADLKQETTMKADSLLAEETKNLPEDIPLDSVPTENKLEDEQKNNDVQQADSLRDAERDILAKNPMLNQLENQRRGIKRARKKKEVSKAKGVLLSLMCDLCNFRCDKREFLMDHLLSKKHKSKLKGVEGPQAMYGRIGLQALYPPNAVTQSLYHFQGVQQIFHGAQVSDPTAGAPIPPWSDKSAPSAAGVSIS